MKSLVTHINPHLDDIAAIWLIKKFFPEYKNAAIDFISAEKGKEGLSEDESLYIGVGMGKYDEHKGDVGESAMSLVWKDIVSQNLGPKDEVEIKTYEEIVRWNTLIDTAMIPLHEFSDFEVESFIRSYENSKEDSLKTINLGFEILDRIFPVILRTQKGLKDWSKTEEFETKFGKSIAIESSDFSRKLAYQKGYQIVIIKDPKTKFISITAPGPSNVDLTPLYDLLKNKDPESGWFLHQGKKMVLCGASAAPETELSNLTLDQLIEAVKSV